ncbi:ABC transporter ATP-binding protein [Flexistipes sinusarabici]|uniref:ABC transporter ATP-binding protein n=1 Tax=Flexistipes sinusarabici TaxID=2352 RepID=UPI002354724D|nr:ABC transporter ATP-binding protein [Flexistipes sinusarabici]
MNDFIKIEGLKKRYKSKGVTYEALKDITLSLRKGEFVAVKGSSGSGKTTLLSILGTLLSPDEGNIRIDGIDITKLSQERKADFRAFYIGFIFQHFHLLPFLSVYENTMLPLSTIKKEKEYKKNLVEKALSTVGMFEKKNKLPSEISGGEQQRTAIARAIVNEPPLILADEPTGNLDSVNSTVIMEHFQILHEQGHTIVFVTHDMKMSEYADRVIHVEDGLVKEEEIFAKEDTIHV